MDVFQFARELFVLFFAAGLYAVCAFLEKIATIGENEKIELTAFENKAILTFSLVLGVAFVIVCLKETADPDFLKAGGYFFRYLSRKVPYAQGVVVFVSMIVWTYVIVKVSEGIIVIYLFFKRAYFIVPTLVKNLAVCTRKWTQKYFNKTKEKYPLFHS